MIHDQAYYLVNLFPRNFENPGNKPALRSVFLSDDYWLDVYSLIAKMSSKLKSMIISYSGFLCSVNASLKRVHLFAMAITAFLISTTYLEVTIILYVKLVFSDKHFLPSTTRYVSLFSFSSLIRYSWFVWIVSEIINGAWSYVVLAVVA